MRPRLTSAHPSSKYLKAQVAVVHYNRRDFGEAETIFLGLRKSDPYRLENIDTYSNILYVKELRSELSFLAHEATRIEQYRSETCCIVGNFYSLKNRHEKAVLYFSRSSASTLAFASSYNTRQSTLCTS